MVKNWPVVQEMQIQSLDSLGREDPLEKEMATHSSILDWKIPWTEEPGRLQAMGLQRVRHDWETKQQQDICMTQETATSCVCPFGPLMEKQGPRTRDCKVPGH